MKTQRIDENIEYVEVAINSVKARLAKFKLDLKIGNFFPGDDDIELQSINHELHSICNNLKK
jgi:hypothetical protein